jgi:hypothetical protein
VIPIYGVIMPRATLMSSLSSGGTSLDRRPAGAQAGRRDPQISGDPARRRLAPAARRRSVPETAALIRDAAASKPIFAIANTFAPPPPTGSPRRPTSSSASTPSAELGSIGVYAAHQDRSAMQEKLGVKTTLISAGKYKVEGNPFEPLSEEARQAALQAEVDDASTRCSSPTSRAAAASPSAPSATASAKAACSTRRTPSRRHGRRVEPFDARRSAGSIDRRRPPPARAPRSPDRRPSTRPPSDGARWRATSDRPT